MTLIKAQCYFCKNYFEVPTIRAANLVMLHNLPCPPCLDTLFANKIHLIRS
jgi:hypothetical protein